MNVRPDSAYRALGLRDGDVLLMFNEQLFDRPSKATEFLREFERAEKITLQVKRHGSSLTFEYRFQ